MLHRRSIVTRSTRAARVLVAAAAVTVTQLSALTADTHAANVTWDGGGADSSLLTPANWAGDTLPAIGDTAFFDGSTRTAPTADGPLQYLGITFNAGAAAFTIGGTGTITTGASPTLAGNITNNSTALQTFNAPVSLYAGTISATGGDLLFSGLVNLGAGQAASGNTVTVTGGFNTTFAGGITSAYPADTASLNKTGAGTLVLTADSSAYQGRVFINGGAVRITNANALGSGGGQIETALSSGGTGLGTLELDGGTGGFTLTKPVTTRARQDATTDEVSLRNIAGSNTISTVSTGTGGHNFNYESAGGNFTIDTWNTTGSGGARTLRLLGAADGRINNWVPAVGNAVSLVKDGAGTWTLGSGMSSADGSFAATTVNAGTLVLDNGLGARFNGNVTVNSGATLKVISSGGNVGEVGNGVTPTTPTTLTVALGGTLDASTFSVYSGQEGQTLVIGGTVKTGGTLSLYGDNAIHIGDSAASTAVGTMTVQGNLSLSNAFASGTGGLYFNLGNSTTPGSGVNDLISVQGDLQIDNSGGPIGIHLTPLGSGLTAGTYRLIDFTSGATLNPADFTLVGFAPGTSRLTPSITTAANQVNLTVTGTPANLVWAGDGSANVWESAGAANFLNGPTPDKFYSFDNATFDDTTTNTTVNLNGAITLGSATVNTSSTYTFTGSGAIDGGGSVTKSGTGTLIVANVGPNTYTGGTTINAGTLQVGNGGADGSLGTGPITNDGTLVVNTSGNVTLPVINGTGSLIQRGTGSLTLNTENTYTGATTVEAGTVFVNSAAAFGDPATGTTVNPGGSIFFLNPANTYNEPFTVSGDGTGGNGALHTGGAVASTLTGPVTFAANSTFNTDGGSTLNITGTLTGTGDLTKSGSGLMVVGGAGSAWTGNTTVTDGTLQFGAADVAVLPTGAITVAGGTVSFGSTQSVTTAATITGAGTIAAGNEGGTATLTGDLSGFTGTLSTSRDGVASTLVVAVPTAATNLTVADTGSGNGFGILRITNSNALAAGGTILINAQQTGGTGHLELGNNVNLSAGTITIAQRNNLTPAIVSADGDNTLTGNMTITTGGNLAALESSAGSNFTYNGTITHNAGTPRNFGVQGAGNGTVNAVISNSTGGVAMNVVKAGAGTWTLTGANTYTGTTTVNAGRLVLAPAAHAPVTTGPGGAIVNGGRLVFDYAGTSSPAGTVVPLLTTAAASNFATGQIRSTTTDATHTLGYHDNGVSALTVMFTYFGDLNLDGRINGDDYALLDRGFAKSLTGWSNGDVNYDGSVTPADYLLTDTAFASQTGTLSPSLLAARQAQFGDAYVASLIAAVPEPASLGLLTAGALAALSRRRRSRS